jgi:hypothetical protein
MVVDLQIQIKNYEQFRKAFDRGAKELVENIKEAIKFSIMSVEAKTKPITPFDTGALRSRWWRQISNFSASLIPYTDYAVYVHEGTSRWPLSKPAKHGMQRQFLLKGAEAALPSINDFFNQAVDSALQEIANKA